MAFQHFAHNQVQTHTYPHLPNLMLIVLALMCTQWHLRLLASTLGHQNASHASSGLKIFFNKLAAIADWLG